MTDSNSLGDIGDNVAFSPIEPDMIFTCSNTLTCTEEGTAGNMFNLPCDPAKITPSGLIELILCRACAIKVASQRRQQLGSRDAGTFSLAVTIRKHKTICEERALLSWHGSERISQEEVTSRREEEYLRWYEQKSSEANARREEEYLLWHERENG